MVAATRAVLGMGLQRPMQGCVLLVSAVGPLFMTVLTPPLLSTVQRHTALGCPGRLAGPVMVMDGRPCRLCHSGLSVAPSLPPVPPPRVQAWTPGQTRSW